MVPAPGNFEFFFALIVRTVHVKFYSNLHGLNHEWMCEFGLNSLSRRRRPGVFRKQTNYIILFLGEFLTVL